MSITIDDYMKAILDIQASKRPKKIKITSKFAEYIKTIQAPYQHEPVECHGGIIGSWDAIPFEIDDSIENEYYELVYEEEEEND